MIVVLFAISQDMYKLNPKTYKLWKLKKDVEVVAEQLNHVQQNQNANFKSNKL